MGCGEGRFGRVDITPYLRAGPSGQLQTLKIKLSCLAGQGIDMKRVEQPLVLDTQGRLHLVLREVRLSSNEGDAVCPGN